MKKLINSYIWAGLIKPTQAVLPVVGCYVNQYDNEECSLLRAEMAEYAGYNKFNLTQTVSKALEEAILKYLVIEKKAWRNNRYSLTDISRYDEGTSFFPLYKYQIEGGYWAKLKPCEKAVYPVLYVKGTINHPDIVDFPDICCRGWIKDKKDFCKWTGVGYESFKRTLEGLEEKSLLVIDSDGNYDLYRLEVMK